MGKVTFGRTRSSTSSSYQTGARTPSSSPPVCVVVTQAPLPPACTGPGSHALGSVLRADAQAKGTMWVAGYPPEQIRPRGVLWFALLALQLEKDPSCPWQVIWLWGLLKAGKWARSKASPQRSFWQSLEAGLGLSQW